MGKVLVLYDSDTGNTEQMAYLVAEGAKRVEGIEVKIKKVDDAKKRMCSGRMVWRWALLPTWE